MSSSGGYIAIFDLITLVLYDIATEKRDKSQQCEKNDNFYSMPVCGADISESKKPNFIFF